MICQTEKREELVAAARRPLRPSSEDLTKLVSMDAVGPDQRAECSGTVYNTERKLYPAVHNPLLTIPTVASSVP
jgi:hypothetical protein